jgi:hypothetical protein
MAPVAGTAGAAFAPADVFSTSVASQPIAGGGSGQATIVSMGNPADWGLLNSGQISADGTFEKPYALMDAADASTLMTGEHGITKDGAIWKGLLKGGKAEKEKTGFLDSLLMKRRRPDQEVLEKLAGKTVPGVGDTDKVAALLTPEEYVVNKRASMNNRGILETINALGASRKFRLVAARRGGVIGLNTGGAAEETLGNLRIRGPQQDDSLGVLPTIDSWISSVMSSIGLGDTWESLSQETQDMIAAITGVSTVVGGGVATVKGGKGLAKLPRYGFRKLTGRPTGRLNEIIELANAGESASSCK